jgi:hypothetical protein
LNLCGREQFIAFLGRPALFEPDLIGCMEALAGCQREEQEQKESLHQLLESRASAWLR